MIDATVVDKLALVSELHPHLYNLAWFQRGTHISVDRRVLINFSIGEKYSNSTWYNIVPMDACHLLLGRSWQYDRNVLHYGRRTVSCFLVLNMC